MGEPGGAVPLPVGRRLRGRGHAARQRLDAERERRPQAARARLDARRRLRLGLRPRASPVRRRATRARARRRHGLDEPPPQRARIPRPVVARRGALRELGERRDAGPRAVARVGARQRRRVRRRPGQRHDLRPVRRRREGDDADGRCPRRRGCSTRRSPSAARSSPSALPTARRSSPPACSRSSRSAATSSTGCTRCPASQLVAAAFAAQQKVSPFAFPQARRHVARAGLAAARRRQGAPAAPLRSRPRPRISATCPSSSGAPTTSYRRASAIRRRT